MNNKSKIIRTKLFNPKIKMYEKLSLIKSESHSSEFEQFINMNVLIKKEMCSNLKFHKLENVKQRLPYQFTNNVQKELFWILFNIKNESKFINSFLKVKKEFETYFFLCQFKKAETLLLKIQDDFGYSLWSMEMTLLLKEFIYDTKENWSGLSFYLEQLRSPFYRFLLSFYSKRIEENLSFENCFNQFQNDFDTVRSDTMVKDFLVFKSLYQLNYDYTHKDLEGILYIANLFSIIDQYLIVIDVFIKQISQNNNNNKVILQFFKNLGINSIKDSRINNIINLIDSTQELIINENDLNILPIIDEFFIGNYQKCIESCLDSINNNPLVFELYEVYCKSLINLNKDFIPTNISKLIDKILFLVYNSLLYNSESEIYRVRILKYGLIFQSMNFGKQLTAFANSLINDQYINHYSIISCLSSLITNPSILLYDSNNTKSIFPSKSITLLKSSAFNINHYIFDNSNISQIKFSSDQIQSDIYFATKLFKNLKYNETINILHKYKSENVSPFNFENIFFLLYYSYINTNQLLNALKLTATVLSDKKFYTYNLNVHDLVKQLKVNGLENFAKFIDLPIIFSLIFKDYELYEAYVEFMIYQETDLPSKLKIDNLISEFSQEKVIYFFRDVCKISTLQYSLEFNSIDKVEQERLDICSILKQIDNSNHLKYENEIADILRAGAVRRAIKQVDQGRLYVNIESLKNLQQNNLIESFNRYKEIELTTKEKGIIGFNISKEINWINPDYQQIDKNNELNNPAFLAFKSIYLESREKFLFSKEYGLESCLSGRIRHGTLKNLLRSVFEKLNLITSKSEDEYIENLHWKELLSYNLEINRKVQKILKQFSKEIDELNTFIVDSLIQIQTEKSNEKRNGLFNYSTNDALLFEFFNENKSSFDNYNNLIARIYNELAATTSIHLVPFVQKTITGEIKNKFQILIDKLLYELRKINSNYLNELVTNVTKCSTDIQTELDNVAEWFTFNTSDASSILDIVTIINASVELTNKFNPNSSIEPEIIHNYPKDLNLMSSSVMIFVFNILMDNIIKHSKLNSNEQSVKIVIEISDNFLEIRIINSVSPHVDIYQINQRLQKIKSDWNNHESIERSGIEGGSGFDKIKRILLYETFAKTDRFEFKINDYEVSISLFLPYKELNNEQNIDN